MVADITEAVTDTNTVFQNICSFFPGATFLQFSRVSICLSNRHVFPGDAIYMFFEQTQIFQEDLWNKMFFSRTVYVCLSSRHYYLIKQIIFPKTLI